MDITCQKCWEDAEKLSQQNGRSQVNNYNGLMVERTYNDCTALQQAFGNREKPRMWDESNAIEYLKIMGVTFSRGMMTVPSRLYEGYPTSLSAIHYLVNEWDYGVL